MIQKNNKKYSRSGTNSDATANDVLAAEICSSTKYSQWKRWQTTVQTSTAGHCQVLSSICQAKGPRLRHITWNPSNGKLKDEAAPEKRWQRGRCLEWKLSRFCTDYVYFRCCVRSKGIIDQSCLVGSSLRGCPPAKIGWVIFIVKWFHILVTMFPFPERPLMPKTGWHRYRHTDDADNWMSKCMRRRDRRWRGMNVGFENFKLAPCGFINAKQKVLAHQIMSSLGLRR